MVTYLFIFTHYKSTFQIIRRGIDKLLICITLKLLFTDQITRNFTVCIAQLSLAKNERAEKWS